MIEIRDLSMRFPVKRTYRQMLFNPLGKTQTIPALTNICLNINSGDHVAFMGVNGTGKSTLLKLIGGLLYPSMGSIIIDGYNTVKENEKARKNVGFVLNEERSFYWRLSGFQNLEFFGALDNLSRRNLRKRIEDLIDLVGLNDAAYKPVGVYSSGMKQRLAIARGLISDPKILIMDEPTRTLDPEAVDYITQLISIKLKENLKKTLLIATHRFDEVEKLCNNVCVMKKGKVLAVRSISAINQLHGSVNNYYHKLIK